MVDESTEAMAKELAHPSVMDHAAYRDVAKDARPLFGTIRSQVALLRALLSRVQESELDVDLTTRLKPFQSTLAAIDRQSARADEIVATLSESVSTLFTRDVPQIIDLVEQKKLDPFPPEN